MSLLKDFNYLHTFVYILFSSTHQSTPLKPSGVPFGLHNQCISITWLSWSGYVSRRSRRNFERCVPYLCFLHAKNIGTQNHRRSFMRPTAPMFEAWASNAYSILSQLNSIWFSFFLSHLALGSSCRFSISSFAI